MVWFVIFVPVAVVLCFVDIRDLPSVEIWIAALALIAVFAVFVRNRLGAGMIMAGITLISLLALYRMR